VASLLEKLASLRKSGLDLFDQIVASGQSEMPSHLADVAEELSREYGRLAGEALGAIQRSPLLTDVDAVELGRAFKGVRAALSQKRYYWWDSSVMHDEDIVLGVRPAGESEDAVSAEQAKSLFESWAKDIERRLELAVADNSHPQAKRERTTTIKLFISHSSDDTELAAQVVDLMRSALNLPASTIRCTSVDGYRLPGGADTDGQLKMEVRDSEAFVGIVSDRSVQSMYVLFELGARWGAARHLLPLLAPGTPTSVLQGPLSGINALRADVQAQLHQLVSDVGRVLGIVPENPAAYQQHIDRILRLADARPRPNPSGSRNEEGGGSPPSLGPHGWMAN
jgi:hypothetical protein